LADREADAADQHDTKDPIQDIQAVGDAQGLVKDPKEDESQGADGGGAKDVHEVFEARVAPETLVEVVKPEDPSLMSTMGIRVRRRSSLKPSSRMLP